MISQLCGIILEKEQPVCVIDIQGVGYEVQAPMSTFDRLPHTGEKVRLYVQTIIREDAHLLYGFYTQEERELFRVLLKVNSVGPRLALTILSSIAVNEFVRCVLNNDTTTLVALPGIGKKTAERLVIEMRDKLSDWSIMTYDANAQPMTSIATERQQILQDAIAALISLGYRAIEANRAVTKVDDGKATSEVLIRLALKEVASV